jgi:hypothetical protein
MFKSADAALKWSFRVMATDIVKLSSINRMSGGSGSGEMSPHDRHAQAALIMQAIKRILDPVGMAYVMAQYGRELQGGMHERQVSDALVVAVIGSFPTGMHARRGVARLVGAYFGKEAGMISVRTDLGCNNRRYYEYKTWTNDALDRIHRRAIADSHRVLEDGGLIDLAA